MQPLLVAAHEVGHGVVEDPNGLMITAPFDPIAAAETAETIAADIRTW